jgi:cytochrome c
MFAGVTMTLLSGFALGEGPADAARGQRLFMQCSVCHSLPATPGMLGPPLRGIVGQKAGAAPGYPYSSALAAAGLQWDEATLNRWLERPTDLVPGTKMIFAGIANPADRAAVIAYLKSTTIPPKR